MLLAVAAGGCDSTSTSPPKVEITSPPAGESLQKSVLTLNADASDPDGGSIQKYEWTITGPNPENSGGGFRTENYTGNDITTDFLWPEQDGFSDGQFRIEVKVTDDDSQTATTSITTRVFPEG